MSLNSILFGPGEGSLDNNNLAEHCCIFETRILLSHLK